MRKQRKPLSAHGVSAVAAVAMNVARAIREMMTKTNNLDKVIMCDKESGVSYSCNRFVKKELEQGGYLPGGWMRYDAWGVTPYGFNLHLAS